MNISGVLATAVSGLMASARRAQVAADNIVNVNTSDFAAVSVRTTSLAGAPGGVATQTVTGTTGVDLSGELVGLAVAQVSYTANAQVIRVGDSLVRTLIDVTA